MQLRTACLILLALVAFAGNSLLCRAALATTTVDAATFTSIRLISGALVLWMLVKLQQTKLQTTNESNWTSAFALFAYAFFFSFAYRHLSAAAGALILFSAVQITMISTGIRRGERLNGFQLFGLFISFAGLVGLLLPGISTPPLAYALLMVLAGVAWGVYSLKGKAVTQPLNATAYNFLKAVPFAILANLFFINQASVDMHGAVYAIASGAVASGLGYAIWYSVLPQLKATSAASLQLSVPVFATLGGVIFLNETLSMRLIVAAALILAGIGIVIRKK